MVGPEIKSKIKMIGVKENPIIIVGQNPGHNRDGSHTGVVWEKNRSAKLLLEALGDRENIILTNVCNYTEMTPERIAEGYKDIRDLIWHYKPYKMICLGDFAFSHIKDLVSRNIIKNRNGRGLAFYKRAHPSYTIRFNKDKEEWIKEIREIIDRGQIF